MRLIRQISIIDLKLRCYISHIKYSHVGEEYPRRKLDRVSYAIEIERKRPPLVCYFTVQQNISEAFVAPLENNVSQVSMF